MYPKYVFSESCNKTMRVEFNEGHGMLQQAWSSLQKFSTKFLLSNYRTLIQKDHKTGRATKTPRRLKFHNSIICLITCSENDSLVLILS